MQILFNLKITNKSFNKIPKAWRYILLSWVLASLIGLAINPTFLAIGIWRAYFLEPLIFLIIFIYSINKREDKEIIVKSFLILIFYLFLVTIYQYFTNWNLPNAYIYPNVHRLTAIFSQPNMLALLIAPLASFLFVYFLEVNKKMYYLIASLLGFIILFFTKSHGALLAVSIALLFYFIFEKSYRKFSITICALFILFIFIFTSPIQYFNTFKQQLFSPGIHLQITSTEIRSHLWRNSLGIIKDNYLLGTGIRSFKNTMNKYHNINWIEIYPHPHNIFLNVWIELGLFGLIVFLFIIKQIFISLQEMLRRNNKMFYPLALSWITILIHSLVDLPYFKNDLSILFFILLGLTILNISNED